MPTHLNNHSIKDILIVIPVHNESRYVDDILNAVSKYGSDILVINDGSDDDTGKLLKKHEYIKVITHKTNLGYGRSLIDAFEAAKAQRYNWIITMDCDYQHQPSCIPLFYNEIEKDDADIISGSRYLEAENNGTVKPPAERVVINRKITVLLNQMLGLKLTDSFCGFKAYRVESLKKLKLTEKDYGLPLQLWIQAAAANLRVREIAVPLIYHDPKRNFGGYLEVPRLRMQYYMDIIQRELVHNGCKNTPKSGCP